MTIILFGIVTNLAVTAFCVWRVWADRGQDQASGQCVRGKSKFLVDFWSAPGKALFRWVSPTNAVWSLQTPEITPPAWAELSEDEVAANMQSDGFACRTFVAYGWPMLAFRGGETLPRVYAVGEPDVRHDLGWEVLPPLVDGPAAQAATPPTATVSSGGGQGVVITMGFTALGGRQETRTTPYVPIVAGVVVNSGLYAGAWWMVLFLVPAVRRWQRLRRSLCVECGYDRRGIGVDAACPECGTSVGVAS